MKRILIAIALSPIFCSANTLNELVDAKMKTLESSVSRPRLERSFAFEGLVPFQSFEYEYGFDEDESRNRFSGFNFDRDSFRKMGLHTFTVNFKSFQEIDTFTHSRRISDELLKISELEDVNQKRFDAYMSLVQQIVYYRMIKLFGTREKNLNKSVEQSAELLGLPKVNVRDLVNELNRLHKVSSEGMAIKAQAKAFKDMNLKELDAVAQTLLDHMGPLGQRVGELPENLEALSIQRKQLELKLQTIDRQVSWADDRKFLSHFDFRHAADTNENSFRINFNIPWIRFDRENYAREKVLHRLDEQDAERESIKVKSELERKRYEVQGLAAQGENTRDRLLKAKTLVSKVRKVRDIELRQVLADFDFELERDVLVLALRFYTQYLEYLYEAGHFARHKDANFLDPKWIELAKGESRGP